MTPCRCGARVFRREGLWRCIACEAAVDVCHCGELPEPIEGDRVRIAVTVDGVAVVDMDLTAAWLRTRYCYGDILVPFYFRPFTPPDDDGETAPAEPVTALLRLSEMSLRQLPGLPAEPWEILRRIKL